MSTNPITQQQDMTANLEIGQQIRKCIHKSKPKNAATHENMTAN